MTSDQLYGSVTGEALMRDLCFFRRDVVSCFTVKLRFNYLFCHKCDTLSLLHIWSAQACVSLKLESAKHRIDNKRSDNIKGRLSVWNVPLIFVVRFLAGTGP